MKISRISLQAINAAKKHLDLSCNIEQLTVVLLKCFDDLRLTIWTYGTTENVSDMLEEDLRKFSHFSKVLSCKEFIQMFFSNTRFLLKVRKILEK